LADALKKGPVVLYLYPAAFTSGCTIEAHDFAKAMPQFEALGATVIGVSHDAIAKLRRFSVSECRKEFPVASDVTGHIMKEYDAVLAAIPHTPTAPPTSSRPTARSCTPTPTSTRLSMLPTRWRWCGAGTRSTRRPENERAARARSGAAPVG
jgi:hypothetical protein